MATAFSAYQQLLRVFLTPTAVADSYAGLVIASTVRGHAIGPLETTAIGVASVSLYWFGLVLNDIVDVEKDRRLAPQKPIPSGRVPLVAALSIASALAVIAFAAGYWASVPTAVAGVFLLIVAYNAGGKRVPFLGNLLMGACRGGNFLLGAAIACGDVRVITETEFLFGAGLLVVYIAGVTAVSELEEREFSRSTLTTAALPCLAFPLVLAMLGLTDPLNLLNAIVFLALLVSALLRAHEALAKDAAHARAATLFVHQGLACLFFADAGLILVLAPAGERTTLAAFTLYGLFALAWIWKRRWARAGLLG